MDVFPKDTGVTESNFLNHTCACFFCFFFNICSCLSRQKTTVHPSQAHANHPVCCNFNFRIWGMGTSRLTLFFYIRFKRAFDCLYCKFTRKKKQKLKLQKRYAIYGCPVYLVATLYLPIGFLSGVEVPSFVERR